MLGLRAAYALLWSSADVALRQGLQFVISVVLARLLAPEQFGAFAIVMLFTSLGGVFVDAGFSAALIQHQDAGRDDESTVFWFNIVVAAIATSLLIAASPLIAGFFDTPDLGRVVAAMAPILLISAASAVQLSLLVKRLDLKTPLYIGAASTLASGVTAVALALGGYGIWALVAQALVAALATTILAWAVSPWRPAFVFRWTSFRRYFRFGVFTALTGVLETVDARLSAIVLGRLYTAREVGFYVRADSTNQLPSSVLKRVASRVALSAFAQASHEDARLLDGARRAICGLVLLTTPMAIGLAATAGPLVLTLFGQKWASSIPVLAVLALSGVILPHYITTSNLILAKGRSGLLFWIFIGKRVVSMGLLIAAARFGALGIAWSVVAASLIAKTIDMVTLSRLVSYSVRRQLADFAPIWGAAAAMGAGVWAVGRLGPLPAPAMLVLQGTVGAFIYLSLCWILRVPAFRDALNMALKMTGRYSQAPG